MVKKYKPVNMQKKILGLDLGTNSKKVSLSNAIDDVDEIVDRSLRKEINSLIKNGLNKKGILKHFKELQNKWEEKDISRIDIYYWQADEPLVIYSSRTINTDTTLEEMETDQLKHTLSQTPEERLAEHKKIADNVFPKDVNIQKDNGNIIKFKE